MNEGVEVVAIRTGESGIVIGTKDEIIEIPPYVAGEVVDTTGAGDAFNGGLLHGMISGMNLEDAGILVGLPKKPPLQGLR